MKLIKALLARIKRHNTPIFAAAIAFFAFLALVPTLTGAITAYGMAADEQDVIDLVEDGLSSQPESTQDFVQDQMTRIVEAGKESAGLIALLISIGVAFFSASGAVANLMKALNVVYEVEEDRNFVKLRGTALLLLVGTLVVMGGSMFVMNGLPALAKEQNFGSTGETLTAVLRFPILALIMMMGLSVLYQIGPNHGSKVGVTHEPISVVPKGRPKMSLLSLGGIVATVLFVLFTYLFGLYASATADSASGLMGTIAAIMLWFQLVAVAVLIGAEINAIQHSGELAATD